MAETAPENRTSHLSAGKARGYGRLRLGPVGSGVYGGQPVTVMLPLDVVVAADVTYRPAAGGEPLVTAPSHVADAVAAAVTEASAFAGLTGQCIVRVDSDDVETACVAAADGVLRLTGEAVNRAVLADIVTRSLPHPGTGLAFGGPVIVTAAGGVLAAPATGRYPIVTAAAPAGANPPSDSAATDTVIPVPNESLTHADLIDWLRAATDDLPKGPAADAAASVAGSFDGVCFPTPTGLAVLPGGRNVADRLTAVRRSVVRLAAELPPGWRIGITRTAGVGPADRT